MNKRLAVVTPMLNEELDGYIDGFSYHHKPASELINQFVDFVLIIQGSEKPKETTLEKLSKLGTFITIFSTTKSTSHARNIGIEYISREKGKIDYILFLDSDSFIDHRSWQYVFNIFHEPNRHIHEAKVFWGNEESEPSTLYKEKNTSVKRKWQHRMFRSYLWCLIIPTEFVTNHKIKFNERIGPGDKTKFKSGEDTLFLLNLFQLNKIHDVLLHSDLFVHHPARPLDNSKKLTYALGQGNLFRSLFAQNKSWLFLTYLIFWFTLFVGNTLYMLISRKPNSLVIAKMRAKGLFSRSD